MSLTFLPWVQAPLTQAIQTPPAAGNRAGLRLQLEVNGSAVFAVPPTLELIGPGDVVGLDPGQVIRTDPPPGGTEFEQTRFATIEFDSPALPWLLTPDVPAAGHLSPWICLVVVREQEGVTQTPGARSGSTVLRITAPAVPAAELPDPLAAWAWAHAQVAGPWGANDSVQDIDSATPERVLSRLVCARRLEAHTGYLACVVPTYESGRLAGLGLDPGQKSGHWVIGPEMLLPVYHSWRFSTGETGDFLALAARLTGRTCPGLGELDLDLDGSGLPTVDRLLFSGALRSTAAIAEPPASGAVRTALADALKPATARLQIPLYGAAYAGARNVTADAAGWLAELNLDPRWRVAAALGTQIVQAEQEDLVAAAWEQAGDLGPANQVLEGARLARATTSQLVTSHLVPLAEDALTRITAPAHARLLADGETVQSRLDVGDVASAMVSPAFRRLAGRRAGSGPPTALTAHINFAWAGRPVPSSSDGRGGQEAGPVVSGSLRQQLLAGLDAEQTVTRRALARVQRPTGPSSNAFRTTMGRGSKFDADHSVEDSLTSANAAAFDGSASSGAEDPLARALVAPVFPTPLAPVLARLAPEMILPGAAAVPPDTVTVAATNPKFVAALLVGVNSEIGRELTWRGFPVQRTATFFRYFWDFRGQGAGEPDLAVLDAAHSEASLESLALRATGEIVLVLRGDLLRRYPRTLVYAVPTAPGGGPVLDDPARECLPGFAGALDPDLRFFGFALSMAAARGDDGGDGWFFVLQEHSTEARFGPPEGLPPLGAHAAEVARDHLRPAVRVVLPAKRLLEDPS